MKLLGKVREADPTTFTHLIDRYFRTRTLLSLSGNAASVGGQLTASPNNPVAGVPVPLTATPLSGPGVVSDYVLSGSVPASATTALVGLRLNLECGCQSSADITVFRFQYAENNQTTPQATLDFSSGLNGWGLYSNAQTTLEPGPDRATQGLHIVAQSFAGALSGSGGKWQISATGGSEPHWRGDGRELFFLNGNKLMAVEVNGDGESFQAGAPKELFETRLPEPRRNRYDVTADGKRFLLNLPVQERERTGFTVVLNWPALLKR